jgi:hypothetical protein
MKPRDWTPWVRQFQGMQSLGSGVIIVASEFQLTTLSRRRIAMPADPMVLSKADLNSIVEHISVPDSPVGIDAQYTHAIIITYLQQIAARLDQLEDRLNKWEPKAAGA